MSRNLVDDVQRSGTRLARNAHVLFRTEHLIARRRLAVARNRSGLMAIAALLAGIGLVMGNVAVFFWLAASFGNAMTGAILAGANLLVAVIVLAIALRMSAEPELEPAIEMRDLMLAEIETDITDGIAEARKLTDNVRRIASDPLGSAAPTLLAPVLSMILKSLKK